MSTPSMQDPNGLLQIADDVSEPLCYVLTESFGLLKRC